MMWGSVAELIHPSFLEQKLSRTVRIRRKATTRIQECVGGVSAQARRGCLHPSQQRETESVPMEGTSQKKPVSLAQNKYFVDAIPWVCVERYNTHFAL